jgi:hypothetical protein
MKYIKIESASAKPISLLLAKAREWNEKAWPQPLA